MGGRSGSEFTSPSSTVLTAGPPSPHEAGRRLFFHPKHSRLITFAHFLPVFYLRALSVLLRMGTPNSRQVGGAVPSRRQRDKGIPPPRAGIGPLLPAASWTRLCYFVFWVVSGIFTLLPACLPKHSVQRSAGTTRERASGRIVNRAGTCPSSSPSTWIHNPGSPWTSTELAAKCRTPDRWRCLLNNAKTR